MRAAIILIAAMGLSACDNNSAEICTVPASLEVAMAKLGEPYQTIPGLPEAAQRSIRLGDFAEACVHRWSYRLAKSSDPASTVADAVVAGCVVPIQNWSAARASTFEEYRENAYRTTRAEMREQALFNVVQARAGDCPVPK